MEGMRMNAQICTPLGRSLVALAASIALRLTMLQRSQQPLPQPLQRLLLVSKLLQDVSYTDNSDRN